MNKMVKIRFIKYQGTGNDFIIVDGRNELPGELPVKLMCDRHFGIGADGLIILAESSISDFKMIYYNSDGNLSSMCGNGGRCIAHFASIFIFPDQRKFTFEAPDGLHHAIIEQDRVSLSMNDVNTDSTEQSNEVIIMNTGSPHYVSFENIIESEFYNWARGIRYSETFNKEGINVNNVNAQSENQLNMRTYERGVEDETLSCGTGVTAAVLSHALRTNLKSGTIDVNTKGGLLNVSFKRLNNVFKDILLSGEVKIVFEGTWSID